jgi:hypothetical protein
MDEASLEQFMGQAVGDLGHEQASASLVSAGRRDGRDDGPREVGGVQ